MSLNRCLKCISGTESMLYSCGKRKDSNKRIPPTVTKEKHQALQRKNTWTKPAADHSGVSPIPRVPDKQLLVRQCQGCPGLFPADQLVLPLPSPAGKHRKKPGLKDREGRMHLCAPNHNSCHGQVVRDVALLPPRKECIHQQLAGRATSAQARAAWCHQHHSNPRSQPTR